MRYALLIASLFLLIGCGVQYETTVYSGGGEDALPLYTLRSNIPASAKVEGVEIDQKAVPREKGFFDSLMDPTILIPVAIGIAAVQ